VNIALVAAAAFGLALAAAPLAAADLSIGLGADVTSIDPHFHNLTPNNNIGQHAFEPLVAKDAALEQALATVDDARREKLLQEATAIGIGDLGIIPLYHQHNLWATRKGLSYEPRAHERTLAYEFRPR